MADALYSTRYGSEHFIDANGATVQYYGGRSAFRPASVRRAAVQSEYQTLGSVLGSEERFARIPDREQEERRKVG